MKNWRAVGGSSQKGWVPVSLLEERSLNLRHELNRECALPCQYISPVVSILCYCSYVISMQGYIFFLILDSII